MLELVDKNKGRPKKNNLMNMNKLKKRLNRVIYWIKVITVILTFLKHVATFTNVKNNHYERYQFKIEMLYEKTVH